MSSSIRFSLQQDRRKVGFVEDADELHDLAMLELWPREVIEEALRADAEKVFPHEVRLAVLRARIPRYQLAMLEYFSEQHRITVSEVLSRELEGVASEHAEELSAVVPGFADALAWPDAKNTQLTC